MAKPPFKIGDYVTFRTNRDDFTYVVRNNRPELVGHVWRVTGFSRGERDLRYGMTDLELADDPGVTIGCFTRRLEKGFLAQVKTAAEKGKRKNGLRQSAAAQA